jgi:hypothetical protein
LAIAVPAAYTDTFVLVQYNFVANIIATARQRLLGKACTRQRRLLGNTTTTATLPPRQHHHHGNAASASPSTTLASTPTTADCIGSSLSSPLCASQPF